MPGNRSLRVHEADDARKRLDVIVAPDAEILRADAAFARDRGRLGEHERRRPPTARLPR